MQVCLVGHVSGESELAKVSTYNGKTTITTHLGVADFNRNARQISQEYAKTNHLTQKLYVILLILR